jgi:thiol:disulfide interchange protein/DsbC/DsbD-like thiol-disulfide interchange protein
MTLPLRRSLLFFVLALSGAILARAQTQQGVELVKADLIADTSAIAPGKPFTVGVRLVMANDWHTYWKYSGDFGLPTEIQWKLPPGFKAGPIQWPVPERQVTGGDIITFGYEREVLLMAEITPPADLSNAAPVMLKAKASWLVCKESCVPGDAELQLSLPVSARGATSTNAELFAKYRGELPRTFDKASGFAVARSIGKTEIVYDFSGLKPGEEKSLDFYPVPPDPGVVIGAPVVEPRAGGATVRIPLQAEAGTVTQFTGVVAFDRDKQRIGWEIPANVPTAVPSVAASPAKGAVVGPNRALVSGEPAKPAGGLLYFLWLGFLGGLILNVMPCVLPVLSLKIFSFIQQAGEEKGRVFRLGLTYCAGIFTWFMGLAILLAALKGQSGYAVQFQNPFFIVILCAVVFVFSLNLLGVFEIILPGQMQNQLAGATMREGYGGAFFQGLLATVLATSCTAPLLGAALGFALSQPAPIILIMFASVALGMATPILLLSAKPGWMKFLPKPGKWMERVKQITGFVLMGTVLWLLWIVGQMLGSDAIIWCAALLLGLSVAAWLYGSFVTPVSAPTTQRRALIAIALIVGVVGFVTLRQLARSEKPAEAIAGAPADPNAIAWEKFTPTRLDAALAEGRPIFIDFTADWCVNCKFNERTVLDTAEVRGALKNGGFLTLKADWTRNDPDITAILRKFQRAGVPLYLVYPAGGGAPQILPELLTKQIVLDALATATPVKNESPKISRAESPAGSR